MTTVRISKRLAQQVRQRADYQYEYCQSPEWLSGQICQIDHIQPRAGGGATSAENLCLACAACNGFKLDRMAAVDPVSNQAVALFNPRQQIWSEHFQWNADQTEIVGLSACGRATVAALKMNRPLATAARAMWLRITANSKD
ncbi:MAG: HNH endonuclease [Chloroflexi bacterium]|nr:HNH endonuclease [Chloroflexota bacterium]